MLASGKGTWASSSATLRAGHCILCRVVRTHDSRQDLQDWLRCGTARAVRSTAGGCSLRCHARIHSTLSRITLLDRLLTFAQGSTASQTSLLGSPSPTRPTLSSSTLPTPAFPSRSCTRTVSVTVACGMRAARAVHMCISDTRHNVPPTSGGCWRIAEKSAPPLRATRLISRLPLPTEY